MKCFKDNGTLKDVRFKDVGTLFIGVEFKWKKEKRISKNKNKKLKQKINNNHFLLRFHNTAFDVIFAQVIFSVLGASSYNFKITGKYNLHLRSTEGQ